YSSDGKLLASADADGTVAEWLLTSGDTSPMRDEKVASGAVDALLFSPEASTLFVGGPDGLIQVRDAFSLALKARLNAHTNAVTAFAPGPLGATMFSAGLDGRIQEWDMRLGTPRRVLQDEGPLRSLAVSNDGAWLAAGLTEDPTLDGLLAHVYDQKSGKLMRRVPTLTGAAGAVALSPDSKYLAIGDAQGVLLTGPNDTDNWNRVKDFTGPITGLAFRPDGVVLAAASPGGHVALIDPSWHRRVMMIEAGVEVLALAYSPSGRELALACADGQVRIFDGTKGGKARLSDAESLAEELSAILEAGDKTKATETLAKANAAAQKFPSDADLSYLLFRAKMLAHLELKDLLAQLNRTLALEPEHYAAQVTLGIIGYQTEDYAMAEPHLVAAIKIVPDAAAAMQM
ncbi:MAG: hypothetical protein JST92_27765, partial [Deltaproteobacteria bacterium]|nr:hypothetical protein [Deltaproteobacteria bacterium]